jgi:hypothetical protein
MIVENKQLESRVHARFLMFGASETASTALWGSNEFPDGVCLPVS